MPTREVRSATEADTDRLLAVHTAAFPDARGVPARRRNFTANPLGTLDDLHVVVEDGRIVAHAFLFALGVFFGGKVVPTGGIASVGVAPEARGRGIASFLIERLHARSEARGDALTLLHAFRYGFYARSGYARAGTAKRLAIAPRSIPGAWMDAARASVLGPAHELEVLKALHRATASTGCLDRPDALWQHFLLDERIHTVVLERDGQPRGYVAFEHVQAEPHAETRLLVRDLVALDAGARRALVGALGLQGDQCTQIVLEVAVDDPLDLVLGDIDEGRFGTATVEHTFGTVVGGPMVRVLDVPRALTARGWPVDGVVELSVDGVAHRVTATGGTARVERGGSGALVMSRAALGAIAFGSLRANRAREVGLLAGEPSAVERADAILALPPFFSRDSF